MCLLRNTWVVSTFWGSGGVAIVDGAAINVCVVWTYVSLGYLSGVGVAGSYVNSF